MNSGLFGTTGVRGVFNTGFTVEMALKLGLALGTYVNGQRILIARDTRTSAATVEAAFISGASSCGCDIYDLGITTTPTLAYLTKKLDANAGVIVTASHNPPEYIGVKFWSRTGQGYTSDKEQEIERIYDSGDFKKCSWSDVGKILRIEYAENYHIDDILANIDRETIRKRGFRIAVDTGNGAAYSIAPKLLRELNCRVLSLNSQPDGFFPGRPSAPSEKSLTTMISTLKNGEYDLGVAFDGDADRIMLIDHEGNLIAGDQMIAAISRYLLKGTKGKIITTIESSIMVEDIVKKCGGELIVTAVGDINLSLGISKYNAIFGGEECGVFIWPRFHLGPDSLFTLAWILETLAKNNMKLKEFVEGINLYPVVRGSVQCSNAKKQQVMRMISKEVANLQGVVGVEAMDGLNVKMRDCRLLVRPSGTEPLIRIMAEGRSITACEKIVEKIRALITKF